MAQLRVRVLVIDPLRVFVHSFKVVTGLRGMNETVVTSIRSNFFFNITIIILYEQVDRSLFLNKIHFCVILFYKQIVRYLKKSQFIPPPLENEINRPCFKDEIIFKTLNLKTMVNLLYDNILVMCLFLSKDGLGHPATIPPHRIPRLNGPYLFFLLRSPPGRGELRQYYFPQPQRASSVHEGPRRAIMRRLRGEGAAYDPRQIVCLLYPVLSPRGLFNIEAADRAVQEDEAILRLQIATENEHPRPPFFRRSIESRRTPCVVLVQTIPAPWTREPAYAVEIMAKASVVGGSYLEY